MELERKEFKFEIKSVNEDGIFEGYASVFGNKDSYDDVVEPGAFKKTLQEKKTFPLLWYHSPREPIGIVEEAYEDGKGLKIKGKINLAVQRGKEIYHLLKQGAIKGLSIGFQTVKEAWEGNIRKLKEIKLWEISLVTFPANELALVESVKAVVPFQNLPLADEKTPWDKNKAVARVRAWAGGPDKDKIKWSKYRKAFLWYDAEDPENFGSYKLPIADVIDGTLKAVPRAIFAAAAVLQGARGGVNIPDADKEKIKRHLEKYYAKLDRTPPWKKGLSLDEFVLAKIDEFAEFNEEKLQPAIEALKALLDGKPADTTSQKDKKDEEPQKEDILDVLLEEVTEFKTKLMEVRNG